MYKVFIHNHPITFIDSNQIHDFNGIFMFEQLAVSHVKYIMELMNVTNASSQFYIIGQKPDLVMEAFFDKFEKVNAAGGIVECNGHVLLINRNGKWDLPKGKVEKDEQLNETALREVQEETGLNHLRAIKRIEDTYHVYDTYGKDTIKKTAWYVMSVDSMQEGIPQVEEGITELKWVKKEELEDYFRDSYRNLWDIISQYLSLKLKV